MEGVEVAESKTAATSAWQPSDIATLRVQTEGNTSASGSKEDVNADDVSPPGDIVDVGKMVDRLSRESLHHVMNVYDARAKRLQDFMSNPEEQHLLSQQVELARVLKIDANEIRGDTGPILTQHDGYRGKDSTAYDELFDFYQVPPELPLAPIPGIAEAKTPGGTGPHTREFPDKHGILKKFAEPRRWQARYFFLHGRHLRYYKDAAEFKRLSRHVGKGATTAVTEKGCYDLGQASCEVDGVDITLQFRNGMVKRLRATRKSAAEDWGRACMERCRHFSRQDKLRVLRQMALIQSLNIVLKSTDLEKAAHREAEAEEAGLREKTKQLEATLWEAHNEDAETLLKAHTHKMEQLRDVERTMLSDQVSSLSALLGDSDDNAKSLAEMERREAEKNMQDALTVMLKSKLLREAYRNLAADIKEHCAAAQANSQKAYRETAEALEAQTKDHRSQLSKEHAEAVAKLREKEGEEGADDFELPALGSHKSGSITNSQELVGGQNGRAAEYRKELLESIQEDADAHRRQNEDLRAQIERKQQRIMQLNRGLRREAKRRTAEIVRNHRDYLEHAAQVDLMQAHSYVPPSSAISVDSAEQFPEETFWSTYISGSQQQAFAAGSEGKEEQRDILDVDDMGAGSFREGVDSTRTTCVDEDELAARRVQLSTLFQASRAYSKTFHEALSRHLKFHENKFAAEIVSQAVEVQSGLEDLGEQVALIIEHLRTGVAAMDTTTTHVALHRLSKFIPSSAGQAATPIALSELATTSGQPNPRLGVWTAAESLVGGIAKLCRRLSAQTQHLSFLGDHERITRKINNTEHAVRECALQCSVLRASSSVAWLASASDSLDALARMRNHDASYDSFLLSLRPGSSDEDPAGDPHGRSPSFAHGLPGIVCLSLSDIGGHFFHAGYLRRGDDVDGDLTNPLDDKHTTRDCARLLLLQHEVDISVQLVSGEAGETDSPVHLQLALTHFIKGSTVFALFMVPPHQAHAARHCAGGNCALRVDVRVRGQHVQGGYVTAPVASTCSLSVGSRDLIELGQRGASSSANHLIRRRGHPSCATCGATCYSDDATRTIFWQHETGTASINRHRVRDPETLHQRQEVIHQRRDFGHQFLRECCGFARVLVSPSSTAAGSVLNLSLAAKPTGSLGWTSRDAPQPWVQAELLPNAVTGVELLFRPVTIRLELEANSVGHPPALEIRGSVDAETWFVIADFPFIATPAKGGSSRGGATVKHRSNSSQAAVHTISLNIAAAVREYQRLQARGDAADLREPGSIVPSENSAGAEEVRARPRRGEGGYFRYIRVVQSAPHAATGSWNFACDRLQMWGDLKPTAD